tara:strand:+ start:1235 stop:1744 length:510 start_codon:yes stop_codon:yes gene_type:complete
MMFSMFPHIQIEIDGHYIRYPDIFRRVSKNKFFENQIYLESYTITDGEKPEHIAQRLYNNPQYHWIIMLANNIMDLYHDWPLSGHDLIETAKDKYGENGLNQIHHYQFVGEENICVDYDEALFNAGTIHAVTNYDHELTINEGKREIVLLKPEHVMEFTGQFKQLIQKK